MGEQPFLPGWEGPPERLRSVRRRPPLPLSPPRGGGYDHIFLGLLLPPDAASAAFALACCEKAGQGLRGRPIAQERLHITVASLGYYHGRPEWIIKAADAAGRKTAACTPPFEVSFHRLGSFAGRRENRPLVLRDDGSNTALMNFQQRLWEGIGRTGQSGFVPHITLLYDRQLMPEKEVQPVHWIVTDFVLIHSHVGQSRYETLERWPLLGQN